MLNRWGMEMSTSTETDLQQPPDDSRDVPTAPSQPGQQGGVQPNDGSLVSAHTDQDLVRPLDGSLVSAHTEQDEVHPNDGSLVSAHTEQGGVHPLDGSLVSAHTDTGTTQE